MRLNRLVLLLGLTLIPVTAHAQAPVVDPIRELLTEVRALRIAMERSATVGARIQLLVARVQLQEQRIAELSGGNQQKVAIARLLHHGVEVLLLDEPTRGIDVASKAEVYRLIDGLVSREGKAVVWVSSYFPELLGVCDRIAVMSRGTLGPARPVAEWTEERLLLEATAA